MVTRFPFFCGVIWTIAFPLTMTGCGGGDSPPLGKVKGTIKFDGQPLADATVIFAPTAAGGTTSIGKTDAAGAYELYYTSDTKGALLGKHEVKISTFGAVGEGCERTITPEKLPARYNVLSELTADVKVGSNTFNFDLNSGGEIIQPEGSGSGNRRSSGCF